MGSRRLVVPLGLAFLATASCSPCSWADPEVTEYVIDETCAGMITAPAALQLPQALSAVCNGSTGDAPVPSECLQNPSKCTEAELLVWAGKVTLKIDAKLSPSKSPMLNVTLPDPSVTVTAVYVAVPGQPGEVLTVVAGELTIQIEPNHFSSVYAVGLVDAAGDQIAVENATFEARGHDMTYCEPN